jgi:hypothetical protein
MVIIFGCILYILSKTYAVYPLNSIFSYFLFSILLLWAPTHGRLEGWGFGGVGLIPKVEVLDLHLSPFGFASDFKTCNLKIAIFKRQFLKTLSSLLVYNKSLIFCMQEPPIAA